MKICSFLPAATAMIYELGLEKDLHGVTFECHSDKPKVVRSLIEGKDLSSQEIDEIVSKSKAEGTSLHYIDHFISNLPKEATRDNPAQPFQKPPAVLIEGLDYYLENSCMVFTTWYHLKRGTCCGNSCRHCPYGNEA
jgi:hypothetical protein